MYLHKLDTSELITGKWRLMYHFKDQERNAFYYLTIINNKPTREFFHWLEDGIRINYGELKCN